MEQTITAAKYGDILSVDSVTFPGWVHMEVTETGDNDPTEGASATLTPDEAGQLVSVLREAAVAAVAEEQANRHIMGIDSARRFLDLIGQLMDHGAREIELLGTLARYGATLPNWPPKGEVEP